MHILAVCLGFRAFGAPALLGFLRHKAFQLWFEDTAVADASDSWLQFATRVRPVAAECTISFASDCVEAAECRRVAFDRVDPGAAKYSKAAARTTPESQIARRMLLEPPQSSKMLSGCPSTQLWQHKLPDKCLSGAQPCGPFEKGAQRKLLLVWLLSVSFSSRLRLATCMLCMG